MVDPLAQLVEFPLFRDVSLLQVKVLGIQPKHRFLTTGQTLFDRADLSKDVYFLRSGRLLAVYWTEDGRELIFDRIGVGSYFGELAAIDDAPRSLSVYANSKAHLITIEQNEFRRLIDEVLQIRHKILQDMGRKIRNLTERSYQSAAMSVEMRVRAYLVRIALEAGVLHSKHEIKDAPTHAEIANSVSTNREAVSRVMSDLKKSGLIECGRRRIRLLEPDALIQQSME